MTKYIGSRWLKCDFHVHTPASQCFNNKDVTPEMWVQTCLKCGLDCVAVTDHNTNEWIDAIKAAAESTTLTVFPGVELTCDTSKIHLVVLFDKERTSQDIYDFLIRCNIESKDFARPEAYSNLSCFEVLSIAKECGALVIPAHIDEFNGLGLLSKKTIEELFAREEILAAQFVNPELANPNIVLDEDYARKYNNRYGCAEGAVGLEQIKGYSFCVQSAIRNGISLVSFSDNPDEEDPRKHGLFGIGKHYSWLKMDESPTLEGIRQALMIPERVKNCFESKNAPYKEPNLWIKAIEVKGTTLTKKDDAFRIEFNPQLNTIIGGRGSGKSSVFRFLRGTFHKVNDICTLLDIREEQEKFFQKPVDDRGVLKDNTNVVVEFIRDEILHKVEYFYNAETKISRWENGVWEEVLDKGYLDFFAFEQYTQKQVFAVAKNTNALRELIDSGSEEIAVLNREKEKLVLEFITEYKKLKKAEGCRPRIDILQTEIKDLRLKIDSLKDSNISELALRQNRFSKLHEGIENYFEMMQSNLSQLKVTSELNVFHDFDDSYFEEFHKKEINDLLTPLKVASKNLNKEIKDSIQKLHGQIEQSYSTFQKTQFETDRVKHNEEFENKKKELQEQGIDDINNYQKYAERLKVKEEELNELLKMTNEARSLREQLNLLKKSLYDRQTEITQKRQMIVDALSTDKVKISVRKWSDKKKFIHQIREIIQKEKGYDSGLNIIDKQCFGTKPIDFPSAYGQIVDDFYKMKDGNDPVGGFDGWMARLIRELDDEQMAKLETLIPDDQIDVLYKPNGYGNFRSIVSASAGQKTTAVLTYILSQGEIPLLLDQPEDDLDNRLVCDLVVEKIKKIKEKRQIIVITHNANIPVIGDAEYVISMDSNSRYLNIHTKGVLENSEVKQEICDIMEGGEDAFKLRALRYKSILKR